MGDKAGEIGEVRFLSRPRGKLYEKLDRRQAIGLPSQEEALSRWSAE